MVEIDPPDGAEWFWVTGVLTTMLGATFTAIGLLVQKRSHMLNKKDVSLISAAHRSEAYWLKQEWLFGGFLWLLGNLICWASAGLAPQSLLSCLDCWNIIVALVVGRYWFDEHISGRTLIGGSLLVLGVTCVIIFGPKTYQAETAQLIFEACNSVRTLGILGVTAIFLVSTAATAYHQQSRRALPLTCIQLTFVSAILAWYASVLSRSLATLLLTSATSKEFRFEFLSSIFWVFLVAFVFCAASQIHFLNLAMQMGDAVVVLPSYMGMAMIGEIIVGGLFFDEFKNMTFRGHLPFWSAVTCALVGLVILVQGRHTDRTN